ncbi:MAG: serine/threonine-protein kinase [Pseudomonadota bacterium]
MAKCFRCSLEVFEGANFCHKCGSSLEVSDGRIIASSDPLLGRVLADRYRIKSLIGRGGMGVVYKGEHIHMGKTLALKLLSGELATQKDLIKRFKREADAASRLNNMHTVTIFDYGQSQGLIYLVMEYLDGMDLASVIRKEKKLGVMKSLMMMVQTCDSLSEAHEKGIIHRDLKPENIFRVKKKGVEDFIKVLDFGLAKIRVGLGAPDETAHGVVLGTPYYMAPEQIKGEDIDHRSDIYSLGALLYTMVCGHPPFMAPTPLAVMAKHLTHALPELDVDEKTGAEEKKKVWGIISRCMAKDRQQRYSDAAELKDDSLAVVAELASGEFPSSGASGDRLPAAEDATTPAAITSAGDLREDFERYEKMLRVRRMATIFAPVILFGLLAAGALLLFRNIHGLPAGDSLMEVEPNDMPSEADRLPRETARSGFIGKRLSDTESDHDWYRFDVLGRNQVLDVHVDGVPNMDIMIQVFKKGREKAVSSGKAGGRGEDEMVTNLAVDPATYYILVREDLHALGMRPTENISDAYSIKAAIHPDRGREIEPNNALFLSTPMSSAGDRQGVIQGAGDEDYFHVRCVSPGGAGAAVSGIEDLPLVLRAYDADGGLLMTASGSSPALTVASKAGLTEFYVSVSHDTTLNRNFNLEYFNQVYTLSARCTSGLAGK